MKKLILLLCFLSAIVFGCTKEEPAEAQKKEPVTPRAHEITPAEAEAIAREAYTYANPIVDNYRVMYAYFQDQSNPEFKAAWNQLKNFPRVYTAKDRAVQTPNSDTPYSFIGMDLRTEPLVLTVPPIEENRYFSIQLIDLYTHIPGYIGSRTTGNDGGHFLVAGPGWKGEKPEGITEEFHSETDLMLAAYRTQLFNPKDLENVKKIQDGYKVQPLSAFMGETAPEAAKAIDFIKPLTPDEIRKSPAVFSQLNFLLQFCPTHPSEKELMARFAKLGIGAGKAFDFKALPPEIQAAVGQGMQDAWADFMEVKKMAEEGKLTSGDLFGSREQLKNKYIYRMAGAVLGIYGNAAEEALYPSYFVDGEGQKLDGAHRYTLHFAVGQLPPVNAFWSITMYEQPASLLVANPIDRYLLNSPMLPQFKKDKDGGYTFYIQNDSPGTDKEANWLPSPKGPFSVSMRLYWPKKAALDGTWDKPSMQRVK